MSKPMCLNVKRMFFNVSWLLFSTFAFGQNINTRLQQAFAQLERDTQLRHALVSLYVIDANTGQPVFDKNSQIGLAPASTQKIITSATAFEVLGKDYRYKTRFGITVTKEGNVLYVRGSGDPTLGSPRWEKTSSQQVLARLAKALDHTGAGPLYNVVVDTAGWGGESIPDGWIWQDIGNYYGAGASVLNWRENQYDLILRSDDIPGGPVTVVRTNPYQHYDSIQSFVTAGPKGSGDNAYIYQPAARFGTVVRGTIPAGQNNFTISGSTLRPVLEFGAAIFPRSKIFSHNLPVPYETGRPLTGVTYFHEEISPPLDSIIYWFNKKSINLYGEALIKTMAYEKNKRGSTEDGAELIRSFWKEKGLDEEELNIVDGSGLSPLNRVTTHAQVTVLKFAKSRAWYSSFYNALPEYNGMKMKSGTISGAKGFCGYQKSKNGNEYIFSFLVNNYSGSAGALVAKMYKVLDILK